jgi:hypothetical protein
VSPERRIAELPPCSVRGPVPVIWSMAVGRNHAARENTAVRAHGSARSINRPDRWLCAIRVVSGGQSRNGGANGRRPDPGRTQAATCHAEGQGAVVTEARGERPLPRTFADQGAVHPRHRAGRLGRRAQLPTGGDRRDRSRPVGADDRGERCLRHARRREAARAPSGRSPKSAGGFRGHSLECVIRCPAPDCARGVDREGPGPVRRGYRAVGADTDARTSVEDGLLRDADRDSSHRARPPRRRASARTVRASRVHG